MIEAQKAVSPPIRLKRTDGAVLYFNFGTIITHMRKFVDEKMLYTCLELVNAIVYTATQNSVKCVQC